MTHRDRVGDPPGRRGAAGDAGHRQGFPTHSGGSPARPKAASQSVRAASRMARDAPSSPRHALLAESLGKPSLWVIINAPWYKALVKCHGPTEPDPRSWRRGFSFAFARVLIPPMHPDLENVIRQALADARAAGKDYLSQTEEASRPFCRPAPT